MIGIGLGVVLLVVAVALVGLELGMRKNISDRFERDASASLGSPAHADLGATPVLFSALSGTLGSVHLTTDGNDGKGTPAPAIDLTGEDVHEEGDKVHMSSLSGTVFVSDAAMAAAANGQPGAGASSGSGSASGSPLGGLLQVQSVTSDPATGTLKASIGGLAEATVTPKVTAGKLDLTPDSAALFGLPLPKELLGGAEGMLDSTVSQLPEGVEITGVEVVDGGMRLAISGRDVVLDEHGK